MPHTARTTSLGRRVRVIALCLGLLSLGVVSAQAQSFNIVVGSKFESVQIDRKTARAIFSARLQHWPDGRPIKVFVLPDDNPLHRSFVKEDLQLYPYQLRRVWDQMAYSGTGLVPVTVDSPEEMVERLRSTPGSIGYLPIAMAPSAPNAAEETQ